MTSNKNDIDRGRGPGRNIVYTDGHCTSKKKFGSVAGWGMYWGDDNHPFNASGTVEGPPTHPRACLWAACEAAEKAYNAHFRNLTIRTDSRQLYDTMNKHIKTWRHNRWQTEHGKAVANRDLIEELDFYRRRMDIVFEPVEWKVRENEAADLLAWKAAHEALESRGRGEDNNNNKVKYNYEEDYLNGASFTRRHLRDNGDGYESDSSTKAAAKLYYCS